MKEVCGHRSGAFGLAFREMVKIAGLSTSKLSRISEIDRSSLYQIYNGKRLPTREQFDVLMQILRPSTGMFLYLANQYDYEVLGIDSYATLCYFKDFVAGLHVGSDGMKLSTDLPSALILPESSAHLVCKEQSEVLRFIGHFLQSAERGELISAFLPFTLTLPFKILHRELSGRRNNLRVKTLSLVPAKRNAENLSSIISPEGLATQARLLSDEKLTYEGRFWFVEDMPNESPLSSLSYFIIDSKRTFLIDTDFNHAVLIKDQCLRDLLAAKFSRAFSMAQECRKSFATKELRNQYFFAEAGSENIVFCFDQDFDWRSLIELSEDKKFTHIFLSSSALEGLNSCLSEDEIAGLSQDSELRCLNEHFFHGETNFSIGLMAGRSVLFSNAESSSLLISHNRIFFKVWEDFTRGLSRSVLMNRTLVQAARENFRKSADEISGK